MNNKNIQFKNNIIKYNDNEMNSLLYKKAIKIDKRSYVEYYLSLLKRKQVLIFTFFINNDYNSKCVKICLFLFSFSLYFAVNTLFFDDETMHKIYKDKGKYSFIYQIPIILYSTLISGIINTIIKYLSLSENNIIEIKKNKNPKVDEIKKCVIKKISLFFILNFLFLLLFWYYISCFCAVYRNTQVHLIKDISISFGISLLSQIGLCLLPGIFRIPSLRASQKDKKCLYNLSLIIQEMI